MLVDDDGSRASDARRSSAAARATMMRLQAAIDRDPYGHTTARAAAGRACSMPDNYLAKLIYNDIP
ncbi:MAG: hypothetical protein ACOY6K_24340 [Pseudomonadota bacterium]